jgi:translation initiation factor 2B subunit (eIF-2B alpha/beta/delta family)
MKQMTPREALYYIILELGPTPITNRDDNLTARESRLRDSIRALQNFIDYHDDTKHDLPDSANEYIHKDDYIAKPRVRDGLPPLSREDFIE